ncbi:MAG: hypothetical protein U5L96_07495 [Owenweeksia sp.]|nr:hypothetical protein [Owenweeksia sp.]
MISQADGQELSTYAALVEVIRGKKPGDKLELEINRQGKNLRLSIVLASHTVNASLMALQECEARNMHHRLRRIPTQHLTELERQILTQKFGVEATAAIRMDDADLRIIPNPTDGLY